MSETVVNYVNIGIMIAMAMLVAAVILGLSFVVGPRNPNAHKLQPYECGIEEVVPLPRRFAVKFLQVAMLFLIFDVEAVAFYPLATILGKSAESVFLLIELLVFVGLLLVGYMYVWKKGAFRWTS
ncbi:MAG: NADH-quinone oxidoreductase subunit A [Armatimonadetes bacterium]|nr:NADH-quinone oxidoreductase subunit A [Armatimonadota bacterium]